VITHRTREGNVAVARSLADLLAERAIGKGSVTRGDREGQRLCKGLCEAVESLHASGTVHGALRPSVFQLDVDGKVSLLPRTTSPLGSTTLQYASPEVARGAAPTAASDAFSLALVLMEVLVGGPVRTGSQEEIAALAQDGLAPLPDGFPERLQALAVRSTALEPASRPTPARWRAAFERQPHTRTPRGPLLVLLTCVVGLTVVLGVSQQRAAEARDRSAGRYSEARATFEGLLLGTYDELDRVEEIGPLAAAGARALASIEAEEAAGALGDKEMLTLALVWNGRAQRLLGSLPEAKEHFRRAIDVASELGERPFAIEGDVAARIALGEMGVEERDFKVARAEFGRAIELCEGAIRKGTADRPLRLAQARALIRLGDVSMSSGRSSAPRALSLFTRARKALEDPEVVLDGASLDVLELRCDLGKLAANMAFQAGKRNQAVDLLNEHLELAEDLVERDPGSDRARWTLARGADVLGRSQREMGRYLEAAEAHRRSIEAWRLLREMEPARISWRREWAKSAALLADSLRIVGLVEEAVQLHQESIQLMDELMAAGDLSASFTLEVLQQQLSRTEAFLAAGEILRARQELRDLRSRWAKAGPAVLEHRRANDLGIRTNVVEAELLLAQGRWTGARKKALVVMNAIQAEAMAGDDRRFRMDRARALLVSGAVAEAEGDPELAASSRERSLGLIMALRKERPVDPQLLSLGARVLFTFGRDLEAEKAIETLEEMGIQDPRLSALRAAARRLRR